MIQSVLTVSAGALRFQVIDLVRLEPPLLFSIPRKTELFAEVEWIVVEKGITKMIASRPEPQKIITKDCFGGNAVKKWNVGRLTVFRLPYKPGPGVLLS